MSRSHGVVTKPEPPGCARTNPEGSGLLQTRTKPGLVRAQNTIMIIRVERFPRRAVHQGFPATCSIF